MSIFCPYHQERKIHFALVWVIIAVVVVIAEKGSVALCANPVPTPMDEPWISYRHHKYLLSELTGTSFVEMQRIVQQNFGPIPVTAPMTKSWLFPGTSKWAPQNVANGIDYFHHQADGVFELFLCAQVMDEFEKHYKIKQNDIFDADKLENAITLQAGLLDRCQRKLIALFHDNVNENTAAASLEAEFPNAHYASTAWVNIFKTYKAMQPCSLIDFGCFPPLTKEGKVSPWYHNYLATAAFRYELTSVVEANKQKVVAEIDHSMGTINFMIVENAGPTDLASLGKLADLLTNGSGAIAQGGLEKANATFAKLGGKTKIELCQSTRELVAKTYKIDEDSLLPRKFVDVRGHNANDSYIFIINNVPGHALADYPSGAGNFAYDRGMRDFVRPIIAEVLKSTEVSPDSHLPSSDQLVSHASIGLINVDGLFGEPIPNPFKGK